MSVKRWVDSDEWYPVYSLVESDYFDTDTDPVEISEEDFADYQRVLDEFTGWQSRLREIAHTL